jgi:lysophospholipase
VVAFDWRGQGLADRPRHRRDMGHVVSFDEYRQDVAAFRQALDGFDLPGPFLSDRPFHGRRDRAACAS